MSVILLADDDKTLRDMYRIPLTRAGHVVHEAIDGLAVIEIVKTIHFDLILLDIMMPKMNGLDVLKLLRSDDATKHVPIIILTALAQDLSQTSASEIKADRYFSKADTTPNQLVQCVSELLAQKPN
ncbi:MAG: response regulator [Patescibacteria group bacterium]|jgi:CheY-like chemotaxis protein